MLRFFVFLVLSSVTGFVLNSVMANVFAARLVNVFGIEWGSTVYASLVLVLSVVIDYFIVFRFLFRNKGKTNIINEDSPTFVSDVEDDGFEEISFLDGFDDKPDDRLVVSYDVEEEIKPKVNRTSKVSFNFFKVFVLLWVIGISIFAYKVYENLYLELLYSRQKMENLLYEKEFGEPKEFDFKATFKDDSLSGLEQREKEDQELLRQHEELKRDMKVKEMMRE